MKRRMTLALAVAMCAAALFALTACGSSSPSSSSSSASAGGSLEASDQPAAAAGTRDILVIGNDAWEGNAPHADMLCLLHVDLDNHKMYEVSIPRDTKYDFGGGDFDKLNQVLTQRGAAEQTKSAAEVAGVAIDYYVMVDFDGFEQIVDSFGGVNVHMPYTSTYYFYTKDFPDETFEEGDLTLTGWRAMALSRMRTDYWDTYSLPDPDMIRQYMCRQMLTDLVKKAYAGGDDSIAQLFAALQPFILETNIPLDDQVAWAQALGSAGSFEVIGTTGPFFGGNDETLNGNWLVFPDETGWKNLMAAVLGGGDAAAVTAATETFEHPDFDEGTERASSTVVTVG